MTPFIVIVAASVLGELTFLTLFGRPWRHAERATSWLIVAWANASLVVDAVLLFALLKIRLPMWWVVFPLFVAKSLVVWYRVGVLWWTRRRLADN